MHFASPASPPHYMRHPIETLHSGSRATEALLNVAQRDGARFVLASTSELRNPSNTPKPKSTGATSIRTAPEACTTGKRYAEAITAAYRRSFEVNTGMVRIFNTYGPRMDPNDGRAVPSFIGAGLRGEPFRCTATGPRRGRSATFRTWSRASWLSPSLITAAPSTSGTRGNNRSWKLLN